MHCQLICYWLQTRESVYQPAGVWVTPLHNVSYEMPCFERTQKYTWMLAVLAATAAHGAASHMASYMVISRGSDADADISWGRNPPTDIRMH